MSKLTAYRQKCSQSESKGEPSLPSFSSIGYSLTTDKLTWFLLDLEHKTPSTLQGTGDGVGNKGWRSGIFFAPLRPGDPSRIPELPQFGLFSCTLMYSLQMSSKLYKFQYYLPS